MRIGFTGTQVGMTAEQKRIFTGIVQAFIGKLVEFHHGDCIGADEQAHNILFWLRDKHECNLEIHVHPPENSSKRAWKLGDMTHKAKPYLDRNKDIVDSCDFMVAISRTGTEELRSGTWSTIRYARKMSVPCLVISPNGNFL